ncbi:putative F-box protein At1g47790 [Rutidosis leptorrhynchoides]|uniref:putative F-box protein At1g47790 n=1 Tax=Rutidosis leptorrhynchoides TaxID=125765 RepID=UPI003A992691
MSDVVPFDIQTEIIKKLPIKSLIRFRSLSKPWKSLIDSSKFIHDNSLRENQTHHLVLRYKFDKVLKYLSLIDDDSFPEHRFWPTVPVTLNGPQYTSKLGSSRGIICFAVFIQDIDKSYDKVVLWNPTIRKSVDVVLGNHPDIVIGFGVCPNTSDPKLVKINCVSWEVEVFTLSSRVWRSISITMPSKPVELSWDQVCINGVIYLLSNDKIDAGRHKRIITFDLKSEELGEVFLSDNLAYSTGNMIVSKLMDSLVVIESFINNEGQKPICSVWKMNHGVLKSFTKLYTVNGIDSAMWNGVLEFRKNGEPIFEEVDDSTGELTLLDVYDPCSGHVKILKFDEVHGCLTRCSVSSYTETLALLNQLDPIIY